MLLISSIKNERSKEPIYLSTMSWRMAGLEGLVSFQKTASRARHKVGLKVTMRRRTTEKYI
jgi:hypothetical protein